MRRCSCSGARALSSSTRAGQTQARRLATRLAVPCVANSQPTLPRMHVVGNPAAQCTGPAPVAIPPYAGAWLTAVPTEHTTMMDPHAMQLALRRRLTCALLCHCGPTPGCGQVVDAYGDHALACPRTGILAGCAKGRNGEDARCARGGRRRRPNRPAAMTPLGHGRLRCIVYGWRLRSATTLCLGLSTVPCCGSQSAAKGPRIPSS